MALRASNQGAFTSLRVAMLVLRRRNDGNIDMPTMREPFKSDIDIGKILNLNDTGVPLDSSPFPVEICMYGGGKGLTAEMEAAATRHHQLVASSSSPPHQVLFDAVSDSTNHDATAKHCHQC